MSSANRHVLILYVVSGVLSSLSFFLCHSILGKSMIAKKGDGSQVKESTDSSTTIEEDDVVKGK